MDANFSAQGWTNCRARLTQCINPRKNPVAGRVEITEGLRRQKRRGSRLRAVSFLMPLLQVI